MPDMLTPLERAAENGDEKSQDIVLKANKMTAQSILFDVKKWTVAAAKKWLSDHSFKSPEPDTTENFHRFRQFDPSECQSGSERTITFGKGIKAVVCKKKALALADEERKALEDFYDRPEAKAVSRVSVTKAGLVVIEHYASSVVKDLNEGDATIVHYISTPRIDPVHDVMDPFGMNDEALMKNRGVFYNHRWHGPGDLPIGKCLWNKGQRDGRLAKTQYAVNESEFAADVYKLASQGYLNSYSIGFSPTRYEFCTVGDLKKVTGGKYDIPNAGEMDPATQVMVHHEWACHEYSQVGVPMNMDAVSAQRAMDLVQSGFGKDLFAGLFGFQREHAVITEKGGLPQEETKGALPYEKHECAAEGMAWNAAAQVRAADVEDLKKMCAWFDSSAPDAKGSYKLPHHTAGAYKTVWRGVAAAMGALLGARGGVEIPAGDKKAVYSHLARHYRDFDKPAPDFKDLELAAECFAELRVRNAMATLAERLTV